VSFLEDLEFPEVVGRLFDHPYERPEWHWDPDADYWSPSYSRQARFPPRPARRPRFTGSATPPHPPDHVRDIVDRYLASDSIARPELVRYAKLARNGRVQ